MIFRLFELLSPIFFSPPFFFIFGNDNYFCYPTANLWVPRVGWQLLPLLSLTPSPAKFLSIPQVEAWFWTERSWKFKGGNPTMQFLKFSIAETLTTAVHLLLGTWKDVTCEGEEESNLCGFVASGSTSGPFPVFPDGSPGHLHVCHIPLHAWYKWGEIVPLPQRSWIQMTHGQMRSVGTLT